MQQRMRESWENAAAVAGLPSLVTGTHLHLGQIKAELRVSVLGL